MQQKAKIYLVSAQYERNGHRSVLHLSSPVDLFCMIKICTIMSALN